MSSSGSAAGADPRDERSYLSKTHDPGSPSMETMSAALDLTTTYLHLRHGRADPMTGGARFWERVTSGELALPGWLVASFELGPASGGADAGYSEMHPNGDEVHVCLYGAVSAVLERDAGDDVIDFAAGQTCLVPQGTWHRLVARESSRIVSLTFGEGTQSRPAR